MRDVLEDESPGLRPASALALTAIAVIAAAVIYNALLVQKGGTRLLAGRTHMQIEAPGGRTIQLKYDPVVEEVQRQLIAAGYYTGMVDGVVGKRTRQAIEAYQKAQGLEINGLPSNDLAEHIRYTKEVAEASLFTGTIEADPDAELRAQIRRVQTGLSELAYSPGEITGEMTDQTRTAIMRFERDRNLAVTGEVSEELMSELTKMSGQTDMNSN
jgi:peptidoglycan hydrolase-like protein with peptidoglycan-binding domain